MVQRKPQTTIKRQLGMLGTALEAAGKRDSVSVGSSGTVMAMAMVQQQRGSGSEGAVNVPEGQTHVAQRQDTIDALNCSTVIDKHNNNVATELMEKMLDDRKMSGDDLVVEKNTDRGNDNLD